MSSEVTPLVQDFLSFLNEAWTPYHAVQEARKRLLDAGFVELDEAEPFADTLKPGGHYFYTRNMSAILAFAVGGAYKAGNGFTMVGAHTDSPCPKLKPISTCNKSGYLLAAVQPYGGGLWHTWFDRDLGLAGRVIVQRGEGKFSHELVKIAEPILRIPTLAIHLTKGEERNKFEPNLQSNFYPVLASEVKAKLNCSMALMKSTSSCTTNADGRKDEDTDNAAAFKGSEKHQSVLLSRLAQQLGCAADEVEDFELQLCDVQPSTVGGILNEFVLSGRLDNLCSSWQCLRALIDSASGQGNSLDPEPNVRLVALFDHEEVGSDSSHGAGGTLLPEALKRISSSLGAEGPGLEVALRKSFLVSADMAHGVHPNYSDRHDSALAPKLHGGVVLKHNANQRYATTAVSGFLFREIGKRAGLPTQEFAIRNDSGCGSTIGPILATLAGIRTVDVGCAQWSMHSCREMMGVDDVEFGYRHYKAVFELFPALDAQLKVDAPQRQGV